LKSEKKNKKVSCLVVVVVKKKTFRNEMRRAGKGEPSI
jgi:hypothetical protein